MSKPIEIDLRRDLPKVRARRTALLKALGNCFYAAPCAIGVMVSPQTRKRMDTMPWCSIDALVNHGYVTMPSEQIGDALALQDSFDSGKVGSFDETLTRLEAKYLTGEVG